MTRIPYQFFPCASKSLLSLLEMVIHLPKAHIFHAPSQKYYDVPYEFENDDVWKKMMEKSGESYPWRIQSSLRCTWMGVVFWVGVDTMTHVPTRTSLHWISFSYDLLDYPVWMTFGSSREESMSHMLWSISDAVEHFDQPSFKKEFLQRFYEEHGMDTPT